MSSTYNGQELKLSTIYIEEQTYSNIAPQVPEEIEIRNMTLSEELNIVILLILSIYNLSNYKG